MSLVLHLNGKERECPERVIIDRGCWGRGHLYAKPGVLCALGFLGEAAGFSRQDMMGEGEFDDVVDEMDSDPDTRNWRYWQDDLATVNDEPYADEHSREVAVADVFSRAGILVEFVG